MSRTIYGVVRSDGSEVSGPGYTILHPSNGVFVISFDQPFTGPPAVVCTHVWDPGNPSSTGGAITDTAVVVGMNGNRVKVHTGFVQAGGSGVIQDRSFSFLAVGD